MCHEAALSLTNLESCAWDSVSKGSNSEVSDISGNSEVSFGDLGGGFESLFLRSRPFEARFDAFVCVSWENTELKQGHGML